MAGMGYAGKKSREGGRRGKASTATVAMMARSFILLLIIVLGYGAPHVAAAPSACSKGWVCVHAAETDDYVDFYAENLKPHAITVSVRVSRTRNLKAAEGKTTTRTVLGNDRTRLLRFAKIDTGKDANFRYVFDWTLGSLNPRHDDSYAYRLPYASSETYMVLQGYGSKFSHTGLEEFTVDFNMPEGTPVLAAREGIVARVEESHNIGCWEPGCGKFANFVMILHSDGTTGEYFHLRQHGVSVEEGEYVGRGQLIGYSGNTGHTTMPHLHFGVYKATSWGKTASIPIVFETADGMLTKPRAGRYYRVK